MEEIQKPTEVAALGMIYELAAVRRRRAAAAPAPRDGAQIGDGARELNRASAIVGAAPDVRAERVAILRAEIERGTYEPDAREVARNILARGL